MKDTHKARLLKELKEIREELLKTSRSMKPEEFDWPPRPGMRSAKALLQEIGATEKVCINVIAGGPPLKWETAVKWSGDNLKSILKDLASIRKETLRYLDSLSHDDLHKPVEMPESWHRYTGPRREPEEMIRWVARHEYYHLGQLIYNRWLLGYNPYKQS
ncbi:DinB family protein [Candidatus Acetothermia bacterium]|jgi:uncharacterized damage-inducible protein DinB|nr:DinB family protein [Candidatus Acetothermia bacterium]MCI2431920.1 DinB family protein [Candidatus Acetothermia bacterium]MCI2437347.1 DinB family protein [Candidatus Acetothermia bacterium]